MKVIKDMLGQYPVDQTSGTAVQSVADGYYWCALQSMWSVTVLATVVEVGRTTAFGTCNLFANGTIYGTFTNYTLTSGAIRAYRARL